ncbi:Aldehyde dehydrogenase [hydrothermal vent metagenome]|uniref:Aldehyde dehydrogenase n=1 Tax=hydrothermal vent metagenome TaxID=652676 RepID=A0A3B0TZ70_9ZZZZ
MKKVGPIIDGKELDFAGGDTVEVINPATGKVIAQQLCCNSECVNEIVESSKKAFNSEEWQKMPPAGRGHCLTRLADLVEAHSDELAGLELQDTGKPVSQLKNSEIPLTVSIIRFYAGAADKIEGRVKSASTGTFQFTMYEPYGVVVGILPWNYPLVNVAMKIAPALAAGNAIIIKPSVDTPLTSVAFAKLCIKAGIPKGIVNVALGKGSSTGQSLVEHPEIKKISFTGSTAIGQQIQRQAVDQMKSVNLELGGKNAIIVFADADLDKAANAAIISAFVNAGQLCVSCSRLLVEEPVASEFQAILKEKVDKLRIGDPNNDNTLVGPMITKSQYETALDYIKIASDEGCRVISGGGKMNLPDLTGGFWIEPTILSDVKADMRVATEEIFGPVLSIISFKDEAEAVKISNSVMYGLSGSVWTTDSSRSMRMVKALNTGIIWVNCMMEGYPQIPLPPHKMSGTGVELGLEGMMAYCKQKSAVMSYDNKATVGWNL